VRRGDLTRDLEITAEVAIEARQHAVAQVALGALRARRALRPRLAGTLEWRQRPHYLARIADARVRGGRGGVARWLRLDFDVGASRIAGGRAILRRRFPGIGRARGRSVRAAARWRLVITDVIALIGLWLRSRSRLATASGAS
jgi:hypothetical protein